MENIETKDNKVVETLTKELESLSTEGLHEFFKFFYKMNHTQGCMILSAIFINLAPIFVTPLCDRIFDARDDFCCPVIVERVVY